MRDLASELNAALSPDDRDLTFELDAALHLSTSGEDLSPPTSDPSPPAAPLGEEELSQAAEIVRRAQLARIELLRRDCTRSFARFFRESWPVLEQSTPIAWNWHLEVVCNHIQKMFEWHHKKLGDPSFFMEYQNLAINVPPGTAKSRMLMVAAPAWAWTRWPGMKFLCLSGNPGNVTRDATYCRQLIESHWYQNLFQPGWALRDDQNSILNYANTKGGERISKGITSKLTGDRGSCVVGETRVATEVGDVSIASLHEMAAPPRVWSMNHATGEIELRPIVASRRIARSGIVDVCTVSGNTLRCTGDHKIYSEGTYEEATRVAGRGVSVMWRTDRATERASKAVRQMRECDADVRDVRPGLREGSGRGSEEVTSRGKVGTVLRQSVQTTVAQPTTNYQAVCQLRGRFSPSSKSEESPVLFDEMSRRMGGEVALTKDVARSPVRFLPNDDESVVDSSALLQQDLSKPRALEAYDGQGELPLQRRDESLPNGVSDGSVDSRARRMAMHNVRGDTRGKETDSASCRSRSDEQRAGESDYALRRVPHDSPQIEGTPVLSVDETVESRRGEKVDVYDIQVEGNNNFFANGILVHNCILLDDPNDVKEAESTSIRNKINNDWDGAIYNRVNNMAAAVRIQIQQRIHEEDFTGHVLANGTWAHLKLPLEYEEKNRCECDSCKTGILGNYDQRTEEDEVLHPDRFPQEVVVDLKKTLGEYGYAGQCQQNPDPSRGGKFKWDYWRFWKPDGVSAPSGVRPDRCYKGAARAIPGEFDEMIISVDCAFKGKEENDRVAAFVIGRLGADRFILDRRCDNYDFGETKQIIRELVKVHPRASAVYVEGKANGDAVVSDLRSEISGMISLDPKGGKEARAQVLKPSVEAGQWYLQDGAPWLDDFCHEFAVFPKGRYDDQVDSVSQAAVQFQEPEEDESFAPGRLYLPA